MIIYFIIYKQKLILHLKLGNGLSEAQKIQQIRAALKKAFAKKPGQFIYLDYDLIVKEATARLAPNNLFTALLFSGYSVPTTMEYPFNIWKRFVVVYHPSCTGYFLS